MPSIAFAEVIESSVEQVAVQPGTELVGLDDFTMIAVSWTGAATEPPNLAVRHDGSWVPLEREPENPDSGPDARTPEAASEAGSERFSEPTWVGASDGVRIGQATGVSDLQVHLIRETTTLQPTDATALVGAAVAHDGPAITPRSSWGAQPPTGSISSAPALKMAVIHHTAGSNNYTPGDVPAILRGIQSFHQQSRGWNDIGYNFLVDAWGGIWEGRAGGIGAAVIGAHASGVNTGSVGVALLGTFDSGGASQAALNATAAVVRWKFELHGVNPTGTTTVVGSTDNIFAVGATVTLPTIVGHRDVGQTNCPGQVWGQLPSLRQLASSGYSAKTYGNLDSVSTPDGGRTTLSGWAFDRRDSAPGQFAVTVNNQIVLRQRANVDRWDVAAAVGGPVRSGFNASVRVPDGSSTVCAYAAEATYGALSPVGCTTVQSNTNPIGNLESVTKSNGTATLTGWTLDPDTKNPIDVHVYIDGAWATAATAQLRRDDVAAAYPAAGNRHGFSITVPISEGPRQICAYAINVGAGTTNPVIGCRSVGYNPDPVGEFLIAARHQNSALLVGWALDPDTTDTIGVLFFNNGRMAHLAGAMYPWDQLAGRFPSHGTNRLFFSLMPINRGRNDICAYALNVGPGNPATFIGCHTVVR